MGRALLAQPMMRVLTILAALLLLGCCAQTSGASPLAHSAGAAPPRRGAGPAAAAGPAAEPALHGRFLHVTDLHPDQFYTYNATVQSSCQLLDGSMDDPEAELRAGFWGAPRTECDSPPWLVQRALAWAARAFHQKEAGLDFIIWTGDNVRHDTGPPHPRSQDEIFEFNRWCIRQLQDAFPGVPIVPSIGNNDIYPHNIMWPGPNDVTFMYARMWSQFGLLPETEAHVCSIGGYFATDVIPATLTVFSLNTMYWFKSNKIVDGCDSSRNDPGGLQLDWLEAQLERTRSRGMQAHLIGHVPPHAAWYFDDCYERYTELVLRFQDTIVGQHFGHQNFDLFSFHTQGIPPLSPRLQDAEAVKGAHALHDAPDDPFENLLYFQRQMASVMSPYDAQSKDIVALMVDNILRVPPNISDDVVNRYSVASLSPSLVPNWYPTMRVWTYNTSSHTRYRAKDYVHDLRLGENDETLQWGCDTSEQHVFGLAGEFADADSKRTDRKKPKKPKKKPYHRHPASPVRTNRFLTPLGYSQWHLNLDEANRAYETKPPHPPPPDFQLEYATYATDAVWKPYLSRYDRGTNSSLPSSPVPIPLPLLQAELHRYHISPGKGADRFILPEVLRVKTDWEYDALTIPAYLDLSIRLRQSRENYLLGSPLPASRVRVNGASSHSESSHDLETTLWGRFTSRMYATSGVTVEHA